jgi:hypothetical protein
MRTVSTRQCTESSSAHLTHAYNRRIRTLAGLDTHIQTSGVKIHVVAHILAPKYTSAIPIQSDEERSNVVDFCVCVNLAVRDGQQTKRQTAHNTGSQANRRAKPEQHFVLSVREDRVLAQTLHHFLMEYGCFVRKNEKLRNVKILPNFTRVHRFEDGQCQFRIKFHPH